MNLNQSKKTEKIIMAALMLCLIIVATMFVRVPIPLTRGYVHIGDVMIFIAMLILSKRYAVAAAAIGSSLADILGGFAMWAPWTFIAKGGMVFLAASIIGAAYKGDNTQETRARVSAREVFAMVCGGLFMVAVYYAAEVLMYGNRIVPLVVGVPWNIAQFAVGIGVALVFRKAVASNAGTKQLLTRFKQ